MTMHVKIGGAWKTAKPYVKINGVWKAVANAYVKVGGAWKAFYNAITVNIYDPVGYDSSFSPDPDTAYVQWTNSGQVYQDNNGADELLGSWLITGSASDYDIYLTQTAGSGTASLNAGTMDTWLSLGTTRTLTLSTGALDELVTASGTYSISLAGQEDPLDSGTWAISAEMVNPA